jgi:hypothetical protein
MMYDKKYSYLIEELAKKNDLVFVGGVAFYFNGLEHEPRDIDVVVTDMVGLEHLGQIEYFDTDFVGSISGKRAYIKRHDINIDIFIENTLPEFNTDGLVKYQTLSSIREHYEKIVSQTDGKLRDIIIGKLDYVDKKTKNYIS